MDDSCSPPGQNWRRRQPYAPVRGLGNGTKQLFTFYDQGNCTSGWLIDLAALRDVAGNLWECLVLITVRDGLRGDTWARKFGSASEGAPVVNGAVRLWIPYPMVEITMVGIAAGAQTGTVQAQGVCMNRSEGRSLGGTKLTGFRTQTLGAGAGSTTYAVPPGASAYKVGAVNGSSTAIKVTELSGGDDDLGTYGLTPANLVAPQPWYTTPPPTDPSASSNQSAISLATAGGAEDWTVSWLFDLEDMA